MEQMKSLYSVCLSQAVGHLGFPRDSWSRRLSLQTPQVVINYLHPSREEAGGTGSCHPNGEMWVSMTHLNPPITTQQVQIK